MATVTTMDCPTSSNGVQESTLRLLEQRLPGSRGRLRAEFVEGRLVLSGEVTSYYSKQVAQESVREIPGVMQIENRLRVVRS